MPNLIKSNCYCLALILIGILNILFQIELGKYYIGDLFDGRFNNYIFEHFYLSLTNQSESFKQASFFIQRHILFLFQIIIGFLGSFIAFLELLASKTKVHLI